MVNKETQVVNNKKRIFLVKFSFILLTFLVLLGFSAWYWEWFKKDDKNDKTPPTPPTVQVEIAKTDAPKAEVAKPENVEPETVKVETTTPVGKTQTIEQKNNANLNK